MDKKIKELLLKRLFNKEIHKRRLSNPLNENFMLLSFIFNGDEEIELINKWLNGDLEDDT